MHSLFLLPITVSLMSVAQILLKQGMSGVGIVGSTSQQGQAIFTSLFRPLVLAGLLLYFIAALLWLKVLHIFDLSYAFPIMAVSYVVVTILSAALLHEHVNSRRWLSLLVICLGAVMMVIWGHGL